METEIVSRIIDGERWFWYVYYDVDDARREVGVFKTRAEARDAAQGDDGVWYALERRAARRVMVAR